MRDYVCIGAIAVLSIIAFLHFLPSSQVGIFGQYIEEGTDHGTYRQGYLVFFAYAMEAKSCTVNYSLINFGYGNYTNRTRIEVQRGIQRVRIPLILYNGTNKVRFNVVCG